MNLNLNQITDQVERLLPWELTIELDGRTYPTRRPTIGQIVALEQRAGQGKSADGLENLRAMFAGVAPDLSGCSGETLGVLVAVYLTYFQERITKNSKALVEVARAAVTAAKVTPGASS